MGVAIRYRAGAVRLDYRNRNIVDFVLVQFVKKPTICRHKYTIIFLLNNFNNRTYLVLRLWRYRAIEPYDKANKA